jgi:3-oxoacyl-[acyl-carrier protein] reductase
MRLCKERRRKMDLGLKDKVAIITGGGRGIGRQIGLTLAEEGVRVAVTDFYEERARGVAEEIKKAGGSAIAVRGDVTDLEQAKKMAQKTADEWGKIDILCNNAGNRGIIDPSKAEGVRGKFLEMDPGKWSQWVEVNFFGVLNCTRAVLDHMVKQNNGKIINTISDAGRIGEARQSVYSGAKAGVVGFTKALAKEVGKYCINVNCVAPGATYTEATLGRFEDRTEARKAREEKYYGSYPMARGLQRLGLPSDIANMVVFLASDRTEWITGQVISISGGYSMVD